MDCTLFIPHLLPPGGQGDALWRTVDAPQLKRMLDRAAFTVDAAMDADAWLCDRFGIARQQDFPLAPILAAQENLNAGSGYWLCATPVHLETRRNALNLADPAGLDITADESAAFVATLADHLREDSITLYAPHPGRWFLHSGASPSITTANLASVTGRDVRSFLPQGPDSPRWHRILTEIQMLLHSHAMNDARETRGQLPVNSVWLWGGGTLPTAASSPFATVWSDDGIVRALAHHSTCPLQPQPARVTPEKLKDGSHLFSYERLETFLRQGDAQAWSNAVTVLNRDWFMPLLDMLKERDLKTLTLITSNDTGTRQFVNHASDYMKFWHKNKYLR
ncbi:MAG: hypothetical protein ABL891_12115 [Burkholderiales bacterium]